MVTSVIRRINVGCFSVAFLSFLFSVHIIFGNSQIYVTAIAVYATIHYGHLYHKDDSNKYKTKGTYSRVKYTTHLIYFQDCPDFIIPVNISA